MADDNPLANVSDAKLVANAFSGGGAWEVEMMRRLKDTLDAEMRVANELSAKIHRLNRSLLWYTVALALMAAFQFGALLRDITR